MCFFGQYEQTTLIFNMITILTIFYVPKKYQLKSLHNNKNLKKKNQKIQRLFYTHKKIVI